MDEHGTNVSIARQAGRILQSRFVRPLWQGMAAHGDVLRTEIVRSVENITGDVVDACREQIRNMHIRGVQPEMIVTSPEDEWKLVEAVAFDMPPATRLAYIESGARKTITLDGVRVVVNPWQEGTVVVPKARVW
jgi:hypothetical protein